MVDSLDDGSSTPSPAELSAARDLSESVPLPHRLDRIDGGGWLLSCEQIGFAAAGATLRDTCRSFRRVLLQVFAIPEADRLVRLPADARAALLDALVRFELSADGADCEGAC
jgi:hypothetical protein